MAAYMYECKLSRQPPSSPLVLTGVLALMEPASMPGNTTFVAGFTQGIFVSAVRSIFPT
jgi:hypothetical protein